MQVMVSVLSDTSTSSQPQMDLVVMVKKARGLCNAGETFQVALVTVTMMAGMMSARVVGCAVYRWLIVLQIRAYQNILLPSPFSGDV